LKKEEEKAEDRMRDAEIEEDSRRMRTGKTREKGRRSGRRLKADEEREED
jgi:hypothetical protein